MLALPEEITLTALLAEYMQYVALFVPVMAAFLAYKLVKRVIRG